MELPRRLILAMCPQRVCTVCGKASERVVETTNAVGHATHRSSWYSGADPRDKRRDAHRDINAVAPDRAERITPGWTDCHCTNDGTHWRTGIVLDPFAGSGTTLEAAQAVGRHAIGIDLDERNADLARERVGMFLEVA
jgi:DNA methylase